MYNASVLSSRARYATRALLDLSLREPNKAVLIQDIAERQEIPLKFLQQMLATLKVAGLLVSRMGPGGGYSLARPPEEVTLGEVIRATDGMIAPISCVSKNRYKECGCPNPDTCVLREAFGAVRDAMSDVLDTTTFADLRDRQRVLDSESGAINYVI